MNDEFEAAMSRIRERNDAFEMYLAGYRRRVVDEEGQSTDLQDMEKFAKHLRKHFAREWREVYEGDSK